MAPPRSSTLTRVRDSAVLRQASLDSLWWLQLALLGVVYGVLTALAMRHGFLEYNADGYTRIIHGHEWRQSPRWEVSVWLPLQTWLFGIGLMVYDSLTFTPRLLNILFTGWTLANIYLIGRALAGSLAGLLGATIALLFPWTVWLGASGMSEPLFHATLSAGVLGFVRWLAEPRDRWLVLASVSLLLSTMVRYEGWFYAAVYALLVCAIAARRERLHAGLVALACLPLAFPLFWIAEHWRQFGDPFQFAHETAAVKELLAADNARASFIRRLTVYPEEAARLAPRLAGFCLLAAGYAAYRRVWWWPLIALIAGQAALFAGVSAGFSNLGPGAERYLLSNAMLLFPVLAATIVTLGSRYLRWGALLLLAVCLWPLLPMAVDPPTAYPDDDTRSVAERARTELNRTAGNGRIPVLLPAEPSDAFNASYALRILSQHPDGWLITSDPQLFQAWVATMQPPLWIVDTTVSGDVPSAKRTEQIGRFVVGWPATFAAVRLGEAEVAPSGLLSVAAEGFTPGEQTHAWLTLPSGDTLPLAWDAVASADGAVAGDIALPPNAAPGSWSLTISGLTSAVIGQAAFTVIEDR